MEVMIFTSATCGPCKQLKPILNKLQSEHGFALRTVEAGQGAIEEFKKYDVRSVPTVVATGDAGIVGSFVGMKTEAACVDLLREWGFVK